MKTERIIFHVDVGRNEGLGHLTECLSVAAVLKQKGVSSGFLLPLGSDEAHQSVVEHGYSVFTLAASTWQTPVLLPKFSAFIHKLKSKFLVSNLVNIIPEYSEIVLRTTPTWAVITEHTNQEHALLNFNTSKSPQYMPLHRTFCNRPLRHIRTNAHRLLICFGGSDPFNVSGFVLEMLRQEFERKQLSTEWKLTVILGSLFEYGKLLKSIMATYPVDLECFGPVSPNNLVELALESDVGITAGGGIMYEFCALGLPTIVVPVLDKMEENAKVLEKYGAVICTARADRVSAQSLGNTIRDLSDLEKRQPMSKSAQCLIDGNGAERIANRLIEEWIL